MSIYRLFFLLRATLGAALFVPLGLLVIAIQIYKEIALEMNCYHQFGSEWKQRYENHYGPGSLSEAHSKLTFALVGLLVIAAIAWLIYREVAGKKQRSPGSSRRRRRRSLSH